jgi:hypothetical protein
MQNVNACGGKMTKKHFLMLRGMRSAAGTQPYEGCFGTLHRFVQQFFPENDYAVGLDVYKIRCVTPSSSMTSGILRAQSL